MTRPELNCGYVPLVDCAPLIIAKELGFASEEGLELTLLRQPSWSALRDMLALGHLDVAHMLSPMPVAMSLGMGGLAADIDALMVLSVNGTVFGIAQPLADDLGLTGLQAPGALLSALGRRDAPPLRIGVPFPYSMHHLLLSYWLAGQTELEVEVISVPPPRMAEALADGQVDAFWVGEPWGSVIVDRGVGQLLMTGGDVWGFAPEKVLAARTQWTAENPDTVRRLMRAVYQASRWLDTTENKPLAVEILARSEHLDLAPEVIWPAVTGQLTPTRHGAPSQIDNFLLFHRHGATFPWRSQAAWIAERLGADATGQARAKQCFRTDLYRANLHPVGADLPGASEKVEGAMAHRTAVASTRGHMILGPDAFFDGKFFDFGEKSDQ